MLEILKSMVKEEWRIHSSMFSSTMFALFPVLVLASAFMGSLALPLFLTILSSAQIAMFGHYTFALFGLSVGGFGLFGREIMNRRFGHASLIAYSSRTLPVSERTIFLNFIVKDVIYYFMLWILPFVAGFALASPFISLSLSYAAMLLLTLTLSFLTGLSVVFFLSTVYAHSGKFFAAILFLVALPAVFLANSMDAAALLPPLSLFLNYSPNTLALSLLIISIPSALSLIFIKMDYPASKRRFANSFEKISGWLRFGEYSSFISKDFLDLSRSEGGLGKIIFSFAFPVTLICFMLYMLLRFVPFGNFFLLFSIFLGVISCSIYNWLTEFDLFPSYAFLPVKVSSVIKAKIRSYAIINVISLAILVAVAIMTGQYLYFLPALVAFLSVSSYALAMNIYFTGLYPNIMLYSAKVFLEFAFSIIPVLLVLIFLSAINPFLLVVSAALFPASLRLIRKSYGKWDSFEQPSF